MMKSRLLGAVSICALFLSSFNANSASITGDMIDIFVDHGLESDYTALGGCQFYENLGVSVGAGFEITAANDVGGGICDGGIAVDIDGDAQTITLDNADSGGGDYRWALITIEGIDLAEITGVSLVENNMFTLADNGTVIPDPVINFTDSSITILFDPAGDALFDVTPDTGGFTVFSFTTAVPIPAAIWLFGSGLLGLIGISGRKKSA